MNEKLSYEEWRDRYWGQVTMADELKVELKQLHNIDADTEIESAMRREYELYLNGEYTQ
jgi:hypothetical protein